MNLKECLESRQEMIDQVEHEIVEFDKQMEDFEKVSKSQIDKQEFYKADFNYYYHPLLDFC